MQITKNTDGTVTIQATEQECKEIYFAAAFGELHVERFQQENPKASSTVCDFFSKVCKRAKEPFYQAFIRA